MVLKKEVSDQIKDLLQKNPHGLKITDIVKDININRNTAGRYLENLLVSGQVEMRRMGMAKIYKISQRVPLSAVLSISSEMVIQLDSFLRIIFVNESFCALSGTDRKNLLGKNIEFTPLPLIFDELFVGFIERIREGIAGQEWSGEIVFRAKGMMVFCRIAPTVFEDGRKGVSIILEDVTKKKQGEWALLESEATARALMNSPTDTVILMDTRGIILDLNETAALKFKKYGDPLIGTLTDKLLPKEVAQSRRLLISQVIQTKQMVRFEDERDGRWYDTVAYPIIVDGEVTRIAIIARDVTERKKSEDALRESEERYRKLVEISPDAVIIHQEGRIKYLNPAALSMLGAENAHEMRHKNILDIVHPDYHDAVRRNIKNDLNGKITPPVELRMLRVDGTCIIVEGRGVKTIINGEPAIQVALRDITERKKADDALRESEERLRSTFASMDDLVFNIDTHGIFVGPCNPVMPNLYISPEQFMGKSFRDVLPKALSEQIQKAITDVKNTGAMHQIEYILSIRDKPAWFNAKISSRYSLNGTFNGVTVVARNITDSKLSNIKLQESEEKYRTLINRANDVICVIQDGIIKVCNPHLKEFWGGSLDEVIGRRFTDLVHADSLNDISDRYIRRMAGESVPAIYQAVLKRKDGSRSYVELNAGIISYEGRPADLVIIRDMNDRKRVEDALRKSEELYRTIAETSNDLIFVIGRDDRVEYVNTCASAFIHKPVDRIIGKPRSSLFPSEVAVNQKKALQKVFETGTPFRNEGSLTILGRTHWYDHYLIPLKDPDGTIRSVLGISRDITDRKNTAGPD